MDIQVSRLTGSGKSAVAVILVDGQDAPLAVQQFFDAATNRGMRARQIRYGQWTVQSGKVKISESIVLSPLPGKAFEIHCHGGEAAIQRILSSLQSLGAQLISTVDDGDILQLEAEEVLIRCQTYRQCEWAVASMHQIPTWIDDSIVALTSESLDHTEESIEAIRNQAKQSLRAARVGLHLNSPFEVVLVGPPNVGKSSLANCILGRERSIAHDQAGTTRDIVDSETVIDGISIRLRDTAGLRDGGGEIEQEGMRRAIRAISKADVALLVVDPSYLDDFDALRQNVMSYASEQCVWLNVLNKSDLATPSDWQGYRTIAFPTASGVERLQKAIVDQLLGGFPVGHDLIPITDRQVKAFASIAHSCNASEMTKALQTLRTGARVETR